MVKITDNQKFDFGQLVATRSVADLRKDNPAFDDFVIRSLFRYAVGDWGDCSEGDAQQNDDALNPEAPGRIMAVYNSEDLPTVWIITEWDRSVTTVLFPDEY